MFSFLRRNSKPDSLVFKSEKEQNDYNVIGGTDVFDSQHYRESHEDLRDLPDGFDYLLHYVRYGWQEGRNPNSWFSTRFYLQVHEDVAEAGINPLVHYINNGRAEGRAVSQLEKDPLVQEPEVQFTTKDYSPTDFDYNYYYEKNPDVRAAGVDGLEHYLSAGEKEGRRPNDSFDPVFYYRLNSDVRAAGISAFCHFQQHGYQERRIGKSPLLDSNRTFSTTSKPILFVGHDGIQAGSEIVLLEIIRWFHDHTLRRIKLLLLDNGPLANEYAQFADTYVLPNYEVDAPADLAEFLNESFEFAYLNTVVSGRLFTLLDEYDIFLDADIVTHIHEMEKVIEEHSVEMHALLNQSKGWISASPASTDVLIERYNIPQDDVATVPAFINPVATVDETNDAIVEHARRTLGIAADATVIAGCGTLYWRKGPDIFLEVARKLREKTSRPCEFVWLGDGPDKDGLETSLSEEEKTYIKFAGNRPDANRLLAAADIFFLSSREDPFPLVVLESAQYGIPTVCFGPATGITAFTKDDAGIAVPDMDPDKAAAALSCLVEDRQRRLQLGEVAKTRLFEHYTTDRQNIEIYESIRKHTAYKPSVSVVVPFFNHEQFLDERLGSILSQSIKDIEIIALDDFSSDRSVDIVLPYLSDRRLILYRNTKNSGSPFRQWAKGISLAQSEVVWIAEGDDTCAPDFLATLLRYFDDPMVTIASARTEIINEDGVLQEGALVPYLEQAYPGKFQSAYIKDGFTEVNESLGAVCTLVNASGLLMRKSAFGDALEQARSFKMCGDWLVYLSVLKDGKIAHDPSTVNYFRRHTASAVHKIEGTELYFTERSRITQFVFSNFAVTPRLVNKAFQAVQQEWERFQYKHSEGTSLTNMYDMTQLASLATVTEKPLHVGFYVHGMLFSKGGIERLAADLANNLVASGWQVTLYCRSWGSSIPVYPLYESVSLRPIFDETQLETSISRLRRDLIASEVDVFVPMLSEWLFEPVIEGAQHTGIPIIASEHNDPWQIEERWWGHDKRVEYFRKVDSIHLLLDKFKESLPADLRQKVSVIPNGVQIPNSPPSSLRDKRIIAVGRLEEQKRFDLLIEAAAEIKAELEAENWSIEIYGAGSLRDDLIAQIVEYGLENTVFLMGSTNDIASVYRSSSLFVMPSDFEGFGIALVEALSHGLPSIAFRHCNGPNEIIRHGIDGMLVSDVKDLAISIRYFISLNSEEKQQYQQNAFERSQHFSMELFFDSWEETILSIGLRHRVRKSWGARKIA